MANNPFFVHLARRPRPGEFHVRDRAAFLELAGHFGPSLAHGQPVVFRWGRSDFFQFGEDLTVFHSRPKKGKTRKKVRARRGYARFWLAGTGLVLMAFAFLSFFLKP